MPERVCDYLGGAAVLTVGAILTWILAQEAVVIAAIVAAMGFLSVTGLIIFFTGIGLGALLLAFAC